jgi:hypothetical protein
MRKVVRSIGLAIAHRFGTRITDCRTGKVLGRAIIIPWRGRIHVIGLKSAVIPTFMPQQRLTYWKQELGFTVHDPPDFERVRPNSPTRAGEDESKV